MRANAVKWKQSEMTRLSRLRWYSFLNYPDLINWLFLLSDLILSIYWLYLFIFDLNRSIFHWVSCTNAARTCVSLFSNLVTSLGSGKCLPHGQVPSFCVCAFYSALCPPRACLLFVRVLRWSHPCSYGELLSLFSSLPLLPFLAECHVPYGQHRTYHKCVTYKRPCVNRCRSELLLHLHPGLL